jgi:hypothetical protein
MRKYIPYGLVIALIACSALTLAHAEPAAVHLTFDEASPASWSKSRARRTGRTPVSYRRGGGESAASTDGLVGRAFDGRHFPSQQFANVPVWGTDAEGLPDTELERLFQGARSFTVTAWIKTEALQPQGRLVKTPAFQINYRGDRLETGFARPQRWYGSEVSDEHFGSVGVWRFVAVTWQADETEGVIRYYSGTEQAEVAPAGMAVTDWTRLEGDATGCWLTVGNSEADGNRPFVGLIDEVRLWVAGDASAVRTRDELEQIRLIDLTKGKEK